MANRYSRLSLPQYVPQYTPAPVEQIGVMLSDARDRRESAQLQDARTMALAKSALGTTSDTEGKKFIESVMGKYMPKIEERAKRGYSQQDLIRTQIEGEQAGAAIQSLQNAREQKQAWVEEMRELNRENISDPEELNYWLNQKAPSIQYDNENLAASLSNTPVERLAPDVNYAKKVEDYLSGIKDRDLMDKDGNPLVERVYNPATGEFEITTYSGVDERRVQALLDQAFAADPEIQAYRNRKVAYNTALAEQQGGTETLAALVAASPDEAKSEVQARIATMKEKGFTDAEIAGRLSADNEIRNAQGFGQSKYAYTEFDRTYRTAKEAETDSKGQYTANELIQSEAANNPYVASMPETFAAPTFTSKQNTKLMSLKEEARRIRSRGSNPAAPGMQASISEEDRKRLQEINEELDKMQEAANIFGNNTPLAEQAKSDQVKEIYGDAIKQLVEEHPKESGETEESYKERIGNLYNQKMQYLGSERGYLYSYENDEAREKTKSDVLGDRLTNTPGSIIHSRIFPTGPEGDKEPINFENFVKDELDMELSPNIKEELLDNIAIVGEFRGNDPNIPSGVVIESYVDGERKLFKVEDPNVREQAKFEPLRKISEFKLNPKMSDRTIEITDRNSGRQLKVDFVKEGKYIDGNYRGERIGFKIPTTETIKNDRGEEVTFEEGDIIWEDSPYYQQFLTGITGTQ